MADSSSDPLAEHGLADVWRSAQHRRSQFLAFFCAAYFVPQHMKETIRDVPLLLIKQQHGMTSEKQPSCFLN
jgi:hypothetical protein